jgi:hypothetical protein
MLEPTNVYEIAKSDGLTVGLFSGGYLPQILGGSGVRFDLNNMPMIAGVGETSVVYIGAEYRSVLRIF